MKRGYREIGAFTLVELLVVIGIIALLISILMPSLSKARKAAQEVQCESNLRQLGIGAFMYADSNKGQLAFDGPDGTAPGAVKTYIGPIAGSPNVSGIDDPALWYNAFLKNASGKSYYDLIEQDLATPGTLPTVGSSSIMVCPAATCFSNNSKDFYTSSGYFQLNGYDPAHTGNALSKFFSSYAFNSQLFNSSNPSWKMSQLRPSPEVVFIMERITNVGEYTDPQVQAMARRYPATVGKNITAAGYTSNIAQPKTSWKRMSAAHRHGGYILFADGHVGFLTFAQTQGSNPGSTTADVNQPGLCIWNPLTPLTF